MAITPAERMSHIGQETAFEVLVRARALEARGRSVVHLEIGEPDFDTPSHIVAAPLREERRFRFDPDEFKSLVSDKTRLIIINSPHNPTGSVLTRADLQVIADVARERNLVVLSDEIYSRILYTGAHESIATFD